MSNEEKILAELEVIRTKLPNGELERINNRIDDILKSQDKLSADFSIIQARLFNPDDGLVVKINKNSEVVNHIAKEVDELDVKVEKKKKKQIDLDNKVAAITSRKSSINKALWIFFSGIAGIIITAITYLISSSNK